MLCGGLQLEICYRAARKVYPDSNALQSIAMLVGGLLPMNLYSAQFVGNEPLAGCLTALTFLLALLLISEPEQHRHLAYFAGLGAVWGLAMLSKVSPLVLAPLLVLAIAYRGWMSRVPASRTIMQMAVMIGAATLTAGWYYLRNWYYLGRPFVGGWDPSRGIDWWQDPGYRTWSQFTSFGTSLEQPVYAGYWSLADSLYSTLWTDGFLSGLAVAPQDIPWNVLWLEALAWLGLVPCGCIVLGGLLCCRSPSRPARDCLIFALAMLALFGWIQPWMVSRH
jgi:hypothetical protein